MSKAFTRDDAEEEAVLVVARAPLPTGKPNYVTPRGLAALREELALLAGEGAALEELGNDAARARARHARAMKIEALEARIASAEVIDGRAGPQDEVRFGADVTLRGEGGAERHFRIVGVDEADARHGRIAFVAPLARAVLGKRVGDAVLVRTPSGEEELDVVALSYDDVG